MRAGQDLAVAGCVGAAGTSAIAGLKESRLLERFTPRFIERCQNINWTIRAQNSYNIKLQNTQAQNAQITGAVHGDAGKALCALLREAGAKDWMEAGDGGIMEALWNFFEGSGFGFDIELRAIPIFQETVEVCEFFDLNPYCLQSAGCILLTAENGGDAVRALTAEGISAAVVGKVAKGPGKRIHNGRVHSFLNRPEPDGLYTINT